VIKSSLFCGVVWHRRIRPKAHVLNYRLFNILFDLDELDTLDQHLRVFSRNRFNLFSFYDSDHGDGSAVSLREQVEAHAKASGITRPIGAIHLLCLPRMFGHVFNPISVYFCYEVEGSLVALMYEVNNTFGERHSYFIPVAERGSDQVRQSCEKCFHVSPFMAIEMRYDFRVMPPQETVSVAIDGNDEEGLLITTAFSGRKGELSDRSLLQALVSYPLLTLKVVLAIHWEALRLWRKGIAVHKHPSPPPRPVTIVLSSHVEAA